MPKSTLFNGFSRISTRARLPSLPIHSLRHTHAVLQLESGADMKYVQERLGYGSMAITADVYAHVSKKMEETQMAALKIIRKIFQFEIFFRIRWATEMGKLKIYFF